MAYVPGFDHDVFISYTHLDNVPEIEGIKGWITQLHTSLAVRVPKLIGKPAGFSIWRDDRLQGNDVFDDAILTACARSAVLLPVLSPSYVKSDWCLKELHAFSQHPNAGFGLTIAERARLFPVRMLHVSNDDLPLQCPEQMKRLNGYSFHEYDQTKQRNRQFQQTGKYSESYWDAFDELAHDVSALLVEMEKRAGGYSATARPIYLAEVTDDLERDRRRVKIALTDKVKNAQIRPHCRLPTKKQDAESFVQENLRNAMLSVHMVGRVYGKCPDDDARSNARLQFDMATAMARESDLQRVVWMPSDLEISKLEDEQQTSFLEGLDAHDSVGRIQVIRGGLTDLLAAVDHLLTPPKPKFDRSPDPFLVIDYQQSDEEALTDLRAFLRQQRIAMAPLSNLPGRETTEDFGSYSTTLRNSDGLMVVYGKVPESWVVGRLAQARRITAHDRLPMAIYVAPPPEKRSPSVEIPDLTLLDCQAGFRADEVAPFLASIRSRLVGATSSADR
jgi:hypothetical protein